MGSFLVRLCLDRYVKSAIILAIDVLASVGVSLSSILVARYLFAPGQFNASVTAWMLGGALVFSWLSFMLFRNHRSIIRHATLRTVARLCAVVCGKEALLLALLLVVTGSRPSNGMIATLVLDFLLSFLVLVMIRVLMVLVYTFLRSQMSDGKRRKRTLVYGVGGKSVAVVTRLQGSPHYNIIGFLVCGGKDKQLIDERSIYNFEDSRQIERLKADFGIEAVLFATEADARKEQDRLVDYCVKCGIKVLIVPPIDEMVDGKLAKSIVREIKIEDLLGREEIKISMEGIIRNFQGKTVLVTGAAGSIGSELCRQLATFGVKHLVLFDNAETPMHQLRLELEDRYKGLVFTPVIGDVRQERRLDNVFRTFRPQVVFHAAAYKHVPLMEENPCEAVQVNVTGSRQVADKCIEYDVEKMVMVSTDKAVNPTNIMGCTKRLAEMYVQSLGLALAAGKKQGNTRFVTTRFGNVLGSNGSVIPRFREQIEKGGPVTVTHKDINRFFMTIPEACRLVMEAATMEAATNIFTFDMGESVKIDNLARKMIRLAGFEPDKDIQIAYTGLRPGEKLYEEVLASAENTLPTSHNRIRIARVRENDYAEVCGWIAEMEELAESGEVVPMVRLMKRAVPEFISKNSCYAQIDKELEAGA